MPGKQLLMTFPVTATSHTLADYLARDGYATLRKALTQLKPEDVTKEVTAAGLLGHGGAAFSAGRKWGVVHLNDGQPHYLCANADEGEPGTFKDRWILENAPHLLIESMLIASYALQVRNAFVYIRGEFDLPYRRLAAAVEEALRGGISGRAHSRHRVRVRPRDLPGCRFVRLRRSLGSAVVDRRQARLSAQPPAAAHRPGPVQAAHGGEQRGDAVERRRDRRERRRLVPEIRDREVPGHAAGVDFGPYRPARRVRGRVRLPAGEIPARGLRRNAPGQDAEVHRARRHLHQGAHARGNRAAHLRSPVLRRRPDRRWGRAA